MRILAIEPYYGGSHKAFIDGWCGRSSHKWTLLTMPARKWKWRMRGSAMYFADQVNSLVRQGHDWDVIFVSDMLNLAEFTGLVDAKVRNIKKVAYFHENQITYPYQIEDERDYQFGLTNITTSLAADEVWFNSAFHLNEFLKAVKIILKKMPDYPCLDTVEKIAEKSRVEYLGTEVCHQQRSNQNKIPELKIIWAARWEHDKNPEDFFEAMKIIKSMGVKFKLSVAGESFRQSPRCFEWAREFFKDEIYKWGYQDSFKSYCELLSWADVFVSTANHEFFGLSAVEAALSGAKPILPERLAYPEIFKSELPQRKQEFFYSGDVESLVKVLMELSLKKDQDSLWGVPYCDILDELKVFLWENASKRLDNSLAELVMS